MELSISEMRHLGDVLGLTLGLDEDAHPNELRQRTRSQIAMAGRNILSDRNSTRIWN